ncbi:acetyl-CoA carboxylase carboxyltransferase subunit alpha/beta [Corynebacterium sp. 153RC1]|uniref:acetyl-CoA carboxylase carboxyltransferase subunit alpha/beta n=1 Tax=unclassified Corynebacterium TaxID=2624378 RepID=UPI00211D0121|nr:MULTISPECIES: acetyl-CoA carboxylase carboxyltransferase subunit alpha/beta [unclassified Corynebacterium]MCQ9353357.1 acetyl-CoA carboxylase carboxyltransferase subunit alpha/beta [Corynebacterium sp. 209RC1]MCQ9355528.1 acetyl-CoA carboxylase carboxyltransferase subunit alpha/beta [Corynebacterium sp. 1222RC1]MCQ9357665.1 acetyl-CoA carboxylase carboxyltransferase subunit alpha/beta [Corynebacterium sp. 122RC1]MCQ9359872.1 acetyl-CoA carboxylase carboxyltransferase subunit alpha/beta [Cory
MTQQKTHTSAHELIEKVLDPGTFVSWDEAPEYGAISESYRASLAKAREKTGVDEAVITGEGTVTGHRVAFVLSEFGFLGGSIGAATARRIIAAIHRATAEQLPLLISPSSGGTRMQEGTPAFALMVSITTAVYRHKDANLPFLVYLRNPTTGGVMASWGSAGHFTYAEPGALLGFLGPRVVELTTGTPIPEGVQSGEHLAECGVIDGVISPKQLRAAVTKIVDVVLSPKEFIEPELPQMSNAVEPSSAWEAITETRREDRPGTRDLVQRVEQQLIALSGTGDGRTSAAVTVAIARIAGRPVVLIAQDRHQQPPHGESFLGPEALRFARRGIQLAHELSLPLVSIIDTPGAELSAHAEQQGLAGSIARTLQELVSVDVPTVSVLLGEGCGGGALAMLPADKVLATSNAWLSPLPPEGASAIMFHDTSHAPEMMEEQKVSARALQEAGIVDAIIPEPPRDCDDSVGEVAYEQRFADAVLAHIAHALWELENAPLRVGREQRMRHYEDLASAIER